MASAPVGAGEGMEDPASGVVGAPPCASLPAGPTASRFGVMAESGLRAEGAALGTFREASGRGLSGALPPAQAASETSRKEIGTRFGVGDMVGSGATAAPHARARVSARIVTSPRAPPRRASRGRWIGRCGRGLTALDGTQAHASRAAWRVRDRTTLYECSAARRTLRLDSDDCHAPVPVVAPSKVGTP
jgi:hypothetical protein